MMKVLEETFSLCPDCLRVVPAKYVEINGKVYMQKNCCKKELILVENDVKFFKEFILPFKIERSYISEGMTFQEINRHNLKWNKDVQLYITSKCNLKCPICYQRFCAYQPDLSLDEIKFKINGNGFRHVFLTGGEPTVREDLPQIIEFLTKKGKDVFLITNGIKLANKIYLQRLKEVGLKGVCLSFDGFREKIYETFRGERLLQLKMRVLKNLKEEKIPTYLTCVVEKDVNLNEIKKLIEYASSNLDFIRMLRFGWLFNENQKTTFSDIFKEVAKSLNLNLEYFLEWKKLYFNIYRLMRKIGGEKVGLMLGDTNRNAFYFKAENGKLKPLIELEELKKLNFSLEKSKFGFINLLKLNKLHKFIFLHLFHRVKVQIYHEILKKEKILKICMGGISSPLNIDLKRNVAHAEGKTNIAYDGGKIWLPLNVTVT